MPDISKIKLPGVTTPYDIKDAVAREQIATISAGSVEWAGITTTALSDGSTVANVVVNGKTLPAKKGMMVGYKKTADSLTQEFIYSGSEWQELGGIGTVGELAHKDSVSATYTPAGSNAASSVSFSGGTTHSVLGAATTFTNATSDVTFSGQTSESVDVVTSVGSASTPSTFSTSVSNETLTISWTQGSASTPPSVGPVTVVTAVGTATAAAQKITVGTNDKPTVTKTIGTATAAAQKFTGSGATITST